MKGRLQKNPFASRKYKGQSVFEYIILIAGVIVVFIVFLNPFGPFRDTVENVINGTVDQLNGMVNAIDFPP